MIDNGSICIRWANGREIIFCSDGAISINGSVITNDMDVVVELRRFFGLECRANYTENKNTCACGILSVDCDYHRCHKR